MAGPALIFDAAAWSDQVAADLTRIADVSARDLAIFRDRTEAGDFQCLELRHQGARVGSVLWSVEQEADGCSLVINAAAVEPVAGIDVTRELHARFMNLAKAVGARAVLCWTQRPGLVRKLESLGATRRYVMEILT